jgi:hypothetical protein
LSPSSQLAERLLAHALLCRQVARQSSHEQTAAALEQLAHECVVTAAKASPVAETTARLH